MTAHMMNCDQLVAYATGELSYEQQQQFQKHLDSCATCREELEQFAEVWEALPFTLEDEELPAEWKQEIVSSIVNIPEHTELPPRIVPQRTGRWRSISMAAVAVVLLIGAGSWWTVSQHRTELAGDNQGMKPPAELMMQISLQSFDQSATDASGKAWMMSKGKTTELVLQASGMPLLQGDETYQVWLMKNGNRHNCGTFKVDPQGNGMLTYEISETEREFDAIGVTLEPDANGSAPRGRKMLGS